MLHDAWLDCAFSFLQAIYKRFDVDRSGTISSGELPGAFEAAGGLAGLCWARGGVSEAAPLFWGWRRTLCPRPETEPFQDST